MIVATLRPPTVLPWAIAQLQGKRGGYILHVGIQRNGLQPRLSRGRQFKLAARLPSTMRQQPNTAGRKTRYKSAELQLR